MLRKLDVTESGKHVLALKNTTKMIHTSAFHVVHSRLLPTTTRDANQDNAQASMKFWELPTNATSVNNVQRDQLQTTREEDA